MATRAEQLQAFKQGKQIDPRDVGATDFLKGKQVDDQAGVFFGSNSLDPSARAFMNDGLEGLFEKDPTAKDFIEQWGE